MFSICVLLTLTFVAPFIQPSLEQKAMAANFFFSGLETGETQPNWVDTVDFSQNVGGYASD